MMEITEKEAEVIIDWACVAEMESQYSDDNLVKRIKDAFPLLEIPQHLLTKEEPR